jgi:hypothetical protein
MNVNKPEELVHIYYRGGDKTEQREEMGRRGGITKAERIQDRARETVHTLGS